MITNHQRYRRTDRQTDRRTLYAIPRVHCAVNTAELVIEILSLSNRPIILIFCNQGLLRKSASPLTGAPNTSGSDCRQKPRLYLVTGPASPAEASQPITARVDDVMQ